MRLAIVYKENENVDYMSKFLNIIAYYPEEKLTPNMAGKYMIDYETDKLVVKEC